MKLSNGLMLAKAEASVDIFEPIKTTKLKVHAFVDVDLEHVLKLNSFSD